MKTNKLSIYMSLAAIIAVLFTTSCRDEFTQQQALDQQTAANESAATLDADLSKRNQEDLQKLIDSLRRAGVTVDYSVAVVNGSTTISGTRAKAVADATVSITQMGSTITGTTDASGFANFTGLLPGDIVVNVTASGFTTVNFTAFLDWDDSKDPLAQVQNASQVAIFNASAVTINGTLTGEVDLTNGAREPLASVPVSVKISSVDTDPWNFNVGDEAYAVSATTTTAADGTFSIGAPATIDDSFFQIELNFGDVVANRSFLRINENSEQPEFASEQAFWSQSTSGNSSPDEDPGSTSAPLSNLSIQTLTPPGATTAATFTVTFDDLADTDPTNNTVVIAIATGGAGYPQIAGLDFFVTGGGAADIQRGVNAGTSGAFTQNNFLVRDGTTATVAGTGALGDVFPSPTYPTDVITITGLHTSAPTVTLQENYDLDPPVIYAVIDGGSVDDLDVFDGGDNFFNATSVVTGVTNVIDGSAVTSFTVALNGDNFPFGVQGGGISTGLNSGTLDHIILTAGSGFLDGNDYESTSGAEFTGSFGDRFISNPEPGQTYTLNVFYGEGRPLQ